MLFPKFSCVLSVVLAGLIAMTFIPNFMKTRELSDSFLRALSHAIVLLEENTNLQRPCHLPRATSECMFDLGKSIFPLVPLVQV